MLGYGLAGTVIVVLLIVFRARSMNPKLWARAKRIQTLYLDS